MKRIVVFALVLNAALLGVIAHQLVAIAGGGAVATENGDTNGDGERDISDATYYLRWLFQGGPEPVEIVCPVDQSDRVADLEAQLAAANTANAGLQEELALAGVSEGCNLAGAVLAEADLGDADLEGAVLRGADLRRASLAGADLRGADLEGADLRGAWLARASLEGVDLRGANLRRLVTLRGEMIDEEWAAGQIDGGGLFHAGGGDLWPTILMAANLEGAVLAEADLRNADLRLANLMGANLRRTNFSEADLRGSLVDSNGDGRPDLVLGGPEAEGVGVDIRVGEGKCTGIVVLNGGGSNCLQGTGRDINGDGTVDVYTVDVAEAREAIAAAQAEPAEAGGEGADRVEGPGERLAEECVDGTVDLLDVLRVLVGESMEPGGWNIPRWHIENL